MTPQEFKEARATLGLSGKQMAKDLGIKNAGTIYRYESGLLPISGPVQVCVGFFLRDHTERTLLATHGKERSDAQE